jgi:DNA-binding transcriptional MerR regulator
MIEDGDAEYLRIGQAAKRLGVTVRTLHYWEAAGLVQVRERSLSGYRLYGAEDMERLHRIVIYRELGLNLESIKAILDNPSTTITTLKEQHEELNKKIAQLHTLDTALEKMIAAHEHGLLLSKEEQTEAFGSAWNPQWPEQARQRYSGTKQWQQYAERSASRDTASWKAIADAMTGFEQALGNAMDDDVAPDSPTANTLAERHRELFSVYFPLSRQMQVCLARMYVANPEYRRHYETIHTGLATWLKRAIDANARAHQIDPETARWQ